MFLSTLALPSLAQVAPAATGSSRSIAVGGEGSVFQPDYADNANEGAQTGPQRLYGAGAYVDVRFTHWIQIEAEGRWLHFNEYKGIGENTYLIGPRVPICTFHRFTPYGKFLFGWGSGTGDWLSGRATTFAYGGGVDYRWTRKLTIRPASFEYQQWRVTPSLWP